MTDKFSNVPPDIIRNIALSLSLEEIAIFCRTSRNFNAAVCSSDSFWAHMLQQNYPLLINDLRDDKGEILLPFKFSSFKELYQFASGRNTPEIIAGFTTFQLITILYFLRDIIFYVHDPDIPDLENQPLPYSLSKEEFDTILIEANAGWIADILNGVPSSIFPFGGRFGQDFRIPGVIPLSSNDEYKASSKRALEVEAHRYVIYDHLQAILYRYFFPIQNSNHSIEITFELPEYMFAPLEKSYLKGIFSAFKLYLLVVGKLHLSGNKLVVIVNDENLIDVYDDWSQRYIFDAIYAGFNLSSRDREPDRTIEEQRELNRRNMRKRFEVQESLLRSRKLISPHTKKETTRRLVEEMATKRKKAREILASEQYRNLTPENKEKLHRGMVARGLHPDDLAFYLAEL